MKLPYLLVINSIGKLLSNKTPGFYDFELNILLLSYIVRIWILLNMSLLTLWCYGQLPVSKIRPSNLRQKSFKVADSIRIDSLSIVPNTFSVTGIPASDYRVDYVKSILHWNKKPASDSIKVTYRVFSFQLNSVVQRINFDSIRKKLFVIPYEYNNDLTTQQKGIFDFGNVKANGSFGRQIAFGNSQDAVLNSSLNFQLSGMLRDSIEIQAAITDNNIPIQPDGTTQQLNEFDQVFLQFKKKGWQLDLGDIDIRQSQSYFLNFYKRLQGVSFQNTSRISKNTISKTLVSGSIAKGKFTSNIIQGLEGNQGPYLLQGANKESFLIVLANTERVFLDGELLQRGQDQDYVINYNTAEITFTPKRMITKDSRIQVEFEYADRNYLNSNLYLSQEFDFNKKLKLHLGVFNNADAKNSQINQVLDSKQRQLLANVGDSVQNALYPSAALDTFAAGKILYEKIIVTPNVDSFYQYSTDSTKILYNLSFTDVGQGNGNYIVNYNGANGNVYQYVAPVAGIKQGNYEPVILLVAPHKQQIFDVGLDYSINKNTSLKTEVAMSNFNVNTFSTLNKGDHLGYAAKIQLNNHKQFATRNKLTLSSGIDYEYVQDKFQPLERLRAVEFTRDWGLPLTTTFLPATENLVSFSAGLKNAKNQALSYQFTNYHRSDNYNGFQNSILQTLGLKGWVFNNQYVITNYNTLVDKGSFFRPVIDLSKALKKMNNWRIGFNYSLQQNTSRNKNTDTLNAAAFWFDTYSAYLKSNEAKKNHYNINFSTRSDKYPVGKNFIRGDRSYNLNLQTELLANSRRKLYLNTTFRQLKVYNDSISNQKQDRTILGRLEYVMTEWNGLLAGNILYEVGAGQEQKRDFSYLQVPVGTGQYVWVDYNNDGVQQLNEFELSAFPDQANFIRVYTPTNEYIKANYITLNYSFNVNPKAIMKSSHLKGMKKFISDFNLKTSLQVNKKSIAQGDFEFNPFKYNVNDTALITLNTVWLNTVSFNRFSSKWGIDFSNLRNNGQSLLTYGIESQKLNNWTIKGRWNINRSLLINLNGIKELNALYTPQYENRNYQLDIYSIESRIVYIKGSFFRLSAGYKFENKNDLPLYGGEKSKSNSFNLETKYNILQKSSITSTFTFNNINFDFPTNTTVSYIMLDGLLPGKNYLWSLSFSKRLINNLELSIQYDGRKPASSRTVHVGRASITALF